MYKSQGYNQLSPNGLFFTKKKRVGNKTFTITTNIKTGAFTVEDDEGRIAANYDPKTDKITSSFPDLYAELTKDDPDLRKTKIEVIGDTARIGSNILNDRADSGITEESFSTKDNQDRNSTPGYDKTIDVSEALGNTDLQTQIQGVNKSKDFGQLTYPLTLKDNKTEQDYIQFTIGEYNPSDLKLDDTSKLGVLGPSPSETFTSTLGTIFLPIQPSIVDSNTVAWNEKDLNPLQIAGLATLKNFADDGGQGIVNSVEKLKETVGEDNGAIISALKLKIAQEAVGAQNVLSRFGGAVVNPNLELLFTGPQLRPFNFTFRLSPRSEPEGQQVKQIIRAFKQSMAVKKTKGLFLASPNIFQIKYIQGAKKDIAHPSLNRIKTCALKSCVVDYTPDNSYMTFNDSSNTMVSYNLSLQFQELEPVTDQDYIDPANVGSDTTSYIPSDQIGY